MSTARSAGFRIEGEFITEIARSLFLEDKPSRAWRLIASTLIGDDSKDRVARDVLDGKKKLVGVNNIEVVPDTTSSSYRAQIRSLYAGRIQVEGTWHRPRAVVTSLNEDDAAYASKRYPMDKSHLPGVNPAWAKARIHYYAKKESEIVLEVDTKDYPIYFASGAALRGVPMLFEPCGELPHWWDEPSTVTEAYEQFVRAGGKLAVEGANTTKRPARRRGRPRQHAHVVNAAPPESDSDPNPAPETELDQESRWREAILKQNGDEWIDIVDDDGKVHARAPRKPFLSWALYRTSMRHLAPEWQVVCPMGLKLPSDDPRHSDWYIGAGYSLVDSGYRYMSDFDKAAHNTMYRVQEEIGRFEAGVLVDAGFVSGKVGSEILVIPDLHPDRLDAMLKASAVITEAGGQAAHLAQVATERRITIMLVRDAVARYPNGCTVYLNPEAGTVEMSPIKPSRGGLRHD